ncbi:alpha/beta fold hydrolase [Vibrio breoganii]|nr:alpha/beta fold hydrolase [Vibrio breoganii]PMI16237.1 esterase [Vibrio breoganii]
MLKKTRHLTIAIVATTLAACGSNHNEPLYYQSGESLSSFDQDTFEEYVSETQAWMRAERYYLTEDKEREIALNSPKEYRPSKMNGEAILLVHGLGDSPYSFIDIAQRLSDQGYLVRTMLLPGHGTKVGDLKLVSAKLWQQSVEQQIKLLQREVNSVWLGGYSTGANLVTSYALNDDSLNGLILFSPAFKAQSNLAPMTQWAQYFMDWADQDPEDNYLRYGSLPMKAAASYYETTQQVQQQLSKAGSYDKPVFMLLSEGDTVIDKSFAVQQFTTTFTNPNSHLVWLGDNPPKDQRVSAYSMNLPSFRVSEGSHMGGLFSPDNKEYGIEGKVRICDNGQPIEDTLKCQSGEPVWYSSYGYLEPGKVHARLTFNPYFDESIEELEKVLSKQ